MVHEVGGIIWLVANLIFYVVLIVPIWFFWVRSVRHRVGTSLPMMPALAFGLPFFLSWFVLDGPMIFLTFCLALVGTLHAFGKLTPGSGGAVSVPETTPDVSLDRLRSADPNFSWPLFREQAVLRFAQAYGAAGELPSWLGAEAAGTLRALKPCPIGEVIVGSTQLVEFDVRGDHAMLTLLFDANYTEMRPGGDRALAVLERWTFRRPIAAVTDPPAVLASWSCPSCGYGGERQPGQPCSQCGTTQPESERGWTVSLIAREVTEPRRDPDDVIGGVEEGTNLPTRRSGNGARFHEQRPDFVWDDFERMARTSFLQMQSAWTARNWQAVRAIETDALFNTHRFYLDLDTRRGRVNRLEQVEISQVEWVDGRADACFDSVTVRIFASMVDYTVVEATGTVVAGNAKRPRRFSEYWTFLRRKGLLSAPKPPASCPSCGAGLEQMGQSGVCGYCDRHITLGEFSWVLCDIQQDEVYQPAP